MLVFSYYIGRSIHPLLAYFLNPSFLSFFLPGVDTNLMQKIFDPSYLDKEASTFSLVKEVLEKHGHSVSPWVGESGGAYNSGRNLITNAFAMGFW